ncbi:MAG: glycosyltransferase family 39 protein [Acidimicrobiales bacterium]|nr:glycosyltransferase family 39 protein [Acidimicrobiales bacterium]
MTTLLDASAPSPAASRRSGPGRRFWVVLALLFALGVGLRWYVVLEARPTCPVPEVQTGRVPEQVVAAPGVNPDDGLQVPRLLEDEGPDGCFRVWGDALFGYLQGNLIVRGHWFVNPAAFLASVTDPGFATFPEPFYEQSAGKPPVYPLFVGAVSALGGESATTQRLVLSLVGACVAPLLGLVALRLGGPRAGLLACGIGALYPVLWANDGMLMSESLVAPLAALVILLGYRLWDRPTLLRAGMLGGAIAVLALTRAETVLLYAFSVLPLVLLGLKQLDWRRRVALVAVTGAVGAAVMAPWVGWNLARFREPVLLTSSTGAVLSAASCDTAFYGEYTGYWATCFTGPWPDPLELDESERDAIPRRQAIEYTRDHLARFPVVVAARVGRLWNVYRPLQTIRWDAEIEGRGVWPTRLGLVAYYALLAPAVYGLVVLRRRRLPLSPLLGMAAVVTIAAATSFGILRYRLPADVALVAAAAVGIDAILRRRWPARTGPGEGSSASPEAVSQRGEEPVGVQP